MQLKLLSLDFIFELKNKTTTTEVVKKWLALAIKWKHFQAKENVGQTSLDVFRDNMIDTIQLVPIIHGLVRPL